MPPNQTRLRITGPYPSWGPDAREGELTRSDGKTLRVLVRLLRDQPAELDTLSALQRQAKALARSRSPELLRLVNVSAVGGSAALVYAHFDGASMQSVLDAQRDRGGWLPVKVCVELAAAVAQGVATVTEAVARAHPDHRVVMPGPSPEDVLIDSAGQLRVARVLVAGPDDPPPTSLVPGYTPPEGPDSLQASVYGLGALTLNLLGSQPPPADPDLRRHDEQVRASIVALSKRPGEKVPRAVAQLIRLSMSGNHLVRPSVLAVATQLGQIAHATRGPGVAAWASASIPRVVAGLSAAAASALPLTADGALSPLGVPQGAPLPAPEISPGPPPPRERPLPAPAPPVAQQRIALGEAVDDDPTVRHEELPPLVPLENDSEATQESQLPEGFFDAPPAPPAARSGVGPGLFRSADDPVELDLDPSLEATVTLGQDESEPTVAAASDHAMGERTDVSASSPLEPIFHAAAGDPLDPELEPTALLGDQLPIFEERAPASPARSAPAPARSLEPSVGAPEPSFGAPEPSFGAPERRAPSPAREPSFGAPEPSLAPPAGAASHLGREEPGLAPSSAPLPEDDGERVAKKGGAPRALILVAAALLIGVIALGSALLTGGDDAPSEQPVDIEEPAPETETAPETEPPEAGAAPTEAPTDAPSEAPSEAPPPVATPAQPAATPPEAPSPATAEARPETPKRPASAAPEPEPEPEIDPRISAPTPAPEPKPEPKPEPTVVVVEIPEPEPAPAAPAAPSGGAFDVIFNSGDPAVTGIEVKCHRGTPNGYTPPVVVNGAEAGPCRVTGRSASGGIVTFVEISGPASFTCFTNGEKTCR